MFEENFANLDLLNDLDEEFQNFKDRKETLLGNISRMASIKIKNPEKRDQYISKLSEVFEEEQKNFIQLQDATKKKRKETVKRSNKFKPKSRQA